MTQENAAALVKQAQQVADTQQRELQASLSRAEGEVITLRSRLSQLESDFNTYS